MIRHIDKSAVHLRRRAAASVIVPLVALAATIQLAHAASFKCPHDASVSEKLICNDPQLSALDDKLAVVYRLAKDAAPVPDAIEADRVAQWEWRQHNCKDKACVADWYERRIRELGADVAHGRSAEIAMLAANMAEQRIEPEARAAVVQLKGFGDAMTVDSNGNTRIDPRSAACTSKPGPDSCFVSSAHEAVAGLDKKEK
jgi:uncharacterized protein